MIALDILYIAFATIVVMVILQIFTFVATRVMYPPEPKIIYRDAPAPIFQQQAQPPPVVAPQVMFAAPPQQGLPPPIKTREESALSETAPNIQLPEYEPRKPASVSLRLDSELPSGLQETRPDGL
jgi:hypothetical protein